METAELATSNKTVLAWHVVCGSYEHEELTQYNIVTPWSYADKRHQLFDNLKMPHHTKWQGKWGNEALYIDKKDDMVRGPLGIVWTTETRADEIASWIRDQMFNVPPETNE